MRTFLLFLAVVFAAGQATEIEEKNQITCSLCMTLMEILDANLTDPSNEQAVVDFLDQVCSFLPTEIQAECHALITEYVDDIIELLVNQYLAPADVCDAISLCP